MIRGDFVCALTKGRECVRGYEKTNGRGSDIRMLMRKMTILAFLVAASCLAMSGCAAMESLRDSVSTLRVSPKSGDGGRGGGQDEPAMDAIAKAAGDIHRDLGQLAALQQAQAKRPELPRLPAPTGAMSTEITLKWSGPLAPAAEAVARLVGYRFRLVGVEPVPPPTVNLDVVRRPALTVLENIGWQGGERAGVVVNERERSIEVVYIGRN